MLKKYLFIASTSYSGSTILAFILGSHPNIATIGEVRGLNFDIDPNQYLCSCGVEYLNCPFWSKIRKLLQYKISPDFMLTNLQTKFIPRSNKFIDRLQFMDLRIQIIEKMRDRIYNSSHTHRDYVKEIVLQCRNLAEAVIETYDKDIFLDTSKSPEAIINLYRHLDCEVKIIFIIRDGRGVLNSFIKKKIPLTEKQVIQQWLKTNKKIERTLKSIPYKNIYKLSYDNFCLNPERELKQLSEFIDVDYDRRYFDYGNSEHHIIGNNFRLSVNQEIKHDKSWKCSLSADQLVRFNRLADKYNQKWGFGR